MNSNIIAPFVGYGPQNKKGKELAFPVDFLISVLGLPEHNRDFQKWEVSTAQSGVAQGMLYSSHTEENMEV